MTSPRTIRTLVVVDAVLVTVLVVLAAAWLTSGRSPGGTQAAASPSASATPTAQASPPDAFRLPSGNIACTVASEGVTCTIADFTYAPPAVPGCTGTTGHVITLGPDGVAFPCEDGPAPTAAGDDVRTLEYGSQSRVDGWTCRSATDGVTCTGQDGTGFRLARASWDEVP
ncbi:hypothetical protein [Cellulomonas fimi]|uniref:Uncharacterized protein n=1 Tax=Cellulomonas fimi (strain ATCC 484 / DSM 20113 / JCM 1341 / CCUG 24087 / LMG 16345 / NBRC 15513 / NCIMB 8980 / NCTC 7547 / NRS-133) TaxID=590998 RepID=F4H5T6_CELFA|nr:hypothetical protein [Cellulomonas fimi]AEE45536.1 hypothetical protein Celf_1401 [Cellulomonas fimi ATCC 484]NNH05952.1 hypothetical protein [Cellulomonas fimi]VEH29769.1 Uncharacterised protein [Cellulomonas fimi]